MDLQCAQISNMNEHGRRIPLQIQQPVIVEILQSLKKLNGYQIWKLVKTNEKLEFIRGLLNWNKTKDLTKLIEKLTHPILESTTVNDKLVQFARHLSSSQKVYTRKNLDIPKMARKPETVLDTIVEEADCSRFIRRFLTALKFEELIGIQNLTVLVNWITNVMFDRADKNDVFPKIDFKTAPIAKCFKTKEVCAKIRHQGDKRALQMFTVKNVVSIAAFAVFFKLHTQFVYMSHEKAMVNCWKIGIRKYITKEKRGFMRQYCLKKLPATVPTNKLPSVRFKISKTSLRPIYFAPKRQNWASHDFYKEVNSVLIYICEKQGVQFEQIKSTIWGLRQFLVRKMKQYVDLRRMKLQTADIQKCFSTIDHQKIMQIVENWTPNGLIFVKVGWAQTTKLFGPNRVALKMRLCAAGSSELDAKQLLIFKAEKKDAIIVDFKDVKVFKKDDILKTLRNILNGFGVRIAKGSYQVTKGVPQGHTLSPCLANMYLADFERKYWSEIMKTDEVFVGRYVDDFLMCATDKSKLDALIATLSTTNDYGLRQKKSKSKTSEGGKSIMWCGKNIEFYKMASLVGENMREQRSFH